MMYHGILNIYKEKGYTSHDVVARLRGILRQKRIGHTGTLDPDAEGVLPVCLGRGTRLSQILMDKEKVYLVRMLLGKETDTQDTGGQVLAEAPVSCTDEEVRDAILSFVGSYGQIPPMYSAIKKDGKKLYELARKGKVVEREPRMVTIPEIRILSMDLPYVEMSVRCSRGTYIRTLCHDIGRKLGCGACMEDLVRTRSGRFGKETALRLDEVQELAKSGRIAGHIVSVDKVLGDYPCAGTDGAAGDKLLVNGCKIPADMLCEINDPLQSAGKKHRELQGVPDDLPGMSDLQGITDSQATPDLPAPQDKRKTGDEQKPEGLWRVYTSRGEFAALYRYDSEKEEYRNEIMFYTKE